MVRRSGRRPGTPDTRESILAAAREAFADKGYDAASIRMIATSAGVDPALVHHYFGTKDKLFLAAMNVPIDPENLISTVVTAPAGEFGARIVAIVLDLWESPAGAAALGLLRSSMTNETTARLLRDLILTQALRKVIAGLNLDEQEAPTRAGLVMSHVVGLAVTRYVLKAEPIASTPRAHIVAAVGPTVQHYLTGDLTGVFAPEIVSLPSGVPKQEA
ncbi:TetR family transcriptional regulator [Actinoplanes sp. NPDC051851]|uniref:TetR/AcrR family transcriptional regulator n=1 Tax=Actinoplanes sp. NPDC051851 TaxID=3154753 RepID=UPI0034185725